MSTTEGWVQSHLFVSSGSETQRSPLICNFHSDDNMEPFDATHKLELNLLNYKTRNND